jgi:hypothetical protein
MPKFDPWPVFFKREWNRNWPFLVGFAITGTIITKLSLGLTGTLPPPIFSAFVFLICCSKIPNFTTFCPLIYNHCRGRCEELALRSEAQEVTYPITKP